MTLESRTYLLYFVELELGLGPCELLDFARQHLQNSPKAGVFVTPQI